MKKILLQNKIDPKIKGDFYRYSQLIGVPMNKLIEEFIVDSMERGRLQLKINLWDEFRTVR